MRHHYLLTAALAFSAPQFAMATNAAMPNTEQTAESVDTEKLTAAIADAEAIISDASNYLPGLIADLEDVVWDAKNVLAANSSQTLVNQATAKVKTATTKAKQSEGKTFDYGNISGTYDTNRGFIHPGGLHTQADFDRIKKQLADGNEKVTKAMQVLRTADYAQATAGTYPSETIVRGGSGENYINAARGATIAYQNALRWKIDGTKANADHAVQVLMSWCNTTKRISGSSDQCLAYGLYGYQFAQAAELMRDYEGWKPADFEKFKNWMLRVWYPGCITFLRGRNGTWENSSKWWQAPGHYWSNWGLCNAMAVLSIGVLCDDVFIYNQGLSFIKHDQVGTFKDPRTANPILNDGLTEFWGNLIVTTYDSDLETGAYGKLGQMNESGRDTGHAAMAAGLAVDVAHQIYNQGDDMFAFMDHRLAAGIEYIAAQTQSIQNLPWVNYHYANNGFYYSDSRSWLMTSPALGAQTRPYWGTVIGHYEGIKGVKMPFSEVSYQNMGIDGGGQGGTSGGYDHMGYSVLMNTYDPQIAPADKVPTELSGKIEIDGQTYNYNELGGLKNTYIVDTNKAEKHGRQATLLPQLPEGEEDTGKWKWNTGETTRNITVTTDKSYAYRATYTNKNGVESQQVFTIAVDADCNPSAETTGYIVYKGKTYDTDSITVFYGDVVTLGINGRGGWESYEWENGTTSKTLTTNAILRPREFTGVYINQGGVRSAVKFKVGVKYMQIQSVVNDVVKPDTTDITVNVDDKVAIGINVSSSLPGTSFKWDTGETTPTLNFTKIKESGIHTLVYQVNDVKDKAVFNILVNDSVDMAIPEGNYMLKDRYNDTYFTAVGEGEKIEMKTINNDDIQSQVWNVTNNGGLNNNLQNLKYSQNLGVSARLNSSAPSYPFYFRKALGTEYYEIHNRVQVYWKFEDTGRVIVSGSKNPTTYPLLLIKYDDPTGIKLTTDENNTNTIYNMMGQKLDKPHRGINIINGKKVIMK